MAASQPLDPHNTTGRQAAEAALEGAIAYDELSKSIDRTSSAMEEMIGMGEKLKMSFIDRLKTQRSLQSQLTTDHIRELDLKEKLTHADQNIRNEAKRNLVAVQQRIKFNEKELELYRMINKTGIGPLYYLTTQTHAMFKKMDAAAASFRKELGMFRGSSEHLKNMAQRVAIDLTHIGVTIEGAYNTLKSFAVEMGSVNGTSFELVSHISAMSAQLGVSEKTSIKFLRNMATLAGSSMEAQKSMSSMAGVLANAAGVPLNQVMEDVATSSDHVLLMMSRIPVQAVRAAVELRRMGTDMDKVASTAAKLLDFQSSVNSEMEASVLLGTSINLQRMRQLAYNRDMVGVANEQLRLAKDHGFATKMDYFQQKAFAESLGVSVDTLYNMISAQEQLNRALNSTDPKVAAAAKKYAEMQKSSQDTLNTKQKQFELELMQKSNQERLVAIQQKWNQVVMKLGEIFLPIIDRTLSIVPPLLELIEPLTKIVGAFTSIGKPLQFIGLELAVLFEKSVRLSNIFLRIGEFGETWVGMFKNIGNIINNKITLSLMNAARYGTNGFSAIERIFLFMGKMGGKISSIFSAISRGISPITSLFKHIGTIFPGLLRFAGIFGTFAKAIPVIGWVIMGVQLLYGILSRIGKVYDTFKKEGFWAGIKEGLMAVVDSLYDVLLKPFVDVWKWLKKTFFGNSPSQLGLNILKGIVSVAAMIYDAITWPFRKAFAWILNKIPGMGGIAKKIDMGASGLLNGVQSKVNSNVPTPSAIATTPTQINNGSNTTNNTTNIVSDGNSQKPTQYTIDDIYTMLKTLNDNLTSGKVRAGDIYMDGAKLSTVIAREIQFKGGSYGISKA